MTQVPLCAFAILLVYTGFKLASPAVFKQTYSLGIEQLNARSPRELDLEM